MILLIDATCPKPYDSKTLQTSPLGGTEATVVRVAEGLARRGHAVTVAQHNRIETVTGPVSYVPLDEIPAGRQKLVVALRTPKLLPFIQKNFSNARHVLWCHDYNQQEIVQDFDACLRGKDVTILGVSRTHKGAILDALFRQVNEPKGVKVSFIYNPIDDDLKPDDSTVYHKRLLFFSSPHKGLGRTLEVFKYLRREDRSLHLHIANPGYLEAEFKKIQGATYLGAMSHGDVIKELRSALCVFHLNNQFPETFGLVHAEALAVGTPLITASHGANMEVIKDRRFMLDVNDNKAVMDRVRSFYDERPKTNSPEEFRLSKVLNDWEELLK